MECYHCNSPDCQLCNQLFWPNGEGASCLYMFQAIKPQAENLKIYLDKVTQYIKTHSSEDRPIKLVIVGKDPYPTNPIGIPFAKQTLKDTFESDSGKYLFPSMGVDVSRWMQSNASVETFYDKMLENGIFFLNICYRFLNHKLQKNIHSIYLKCANSVNRAILDKSQNIVFCGDACVGIFWANGYTAYQKGSSGNYIVYPNANYACHPSDPKKSGNWNQYWGSQDKLLNVLEPNGSGPIHNAIHNINA